MGGSIEQGRAGEFAQRTSWLMRDDAVHTAHLLKEVLVVVDEHLALLVEEE